MSLTLHFESHKMSCLLSLTLHFESHKMSCLMSLSRQIGSD